MNVKAPGNLSRRSKQARESKAKISRPVALVADFDPSFPPHPATAAAVLHAADWLGIYVEPRWIGTRELAGAAADRLADYSAVWIAPGSPYQSLDGALAAIRFARERQVPLLGTCGGFQHVVIEYARNVLHIAAAAHEEYDPSSSELFISRLACSLVGQTMQVGLAAGTLAAAAYGSLAAEEQYYCNFGINPEVISSLFDAHASTSMPATDQTGSQRTLIISGSDQAGEPRVIELRGHPFFLATLYVPQMRSVARRAHPLVAAWLAAAAPRGRGG